MAIHENNPLPPATLHVLLALAAQDLHGYGILLEIERISGGEYRVGPGTLYDNLKKLLNLAWIEDYESNSEAGEELRRMYHLTETGRLVLAADIRKMKRVVRVANRRLGAESGQS
jgi:PadR family transcriptional regulator PadR